MRRIALLLVAFVTLFGCTSGDDSTATTEAETTTTTTSIATTTTASTTTTTAPTATTTTQPATADTKESETFPGSGDTAYLTSVDVTEDAVITFAFEGETTPAYRVAYVEPPIVADGSGMELDLEGDAFLQVVVNPGAGVDLTGDEARETFTGPDRFAVDSTDHIAELAETGDFESVLTWTIGLDTTHPFTVEAAPGTLAIEVIDSQDATASLLGADPATCTSPEGFSVSYPADWWASSGQFACNWFAPEAMTIEPGTDVTAPIMISIDDIEYRTAVADSGPGSEIDGAVTTVNGRRAVRTVTAVEEGLYPTGTELTSWLVDVEAPGGSDQTLSATAVGIEAFDNLRNVELLDQMSRTIELDRPGSDDVVAIYRGGAKPFEVTAHLDDSQICLTVVPAGAEECFEPPSGNRVVAAQSDGALVGLAGPAVFEIALENGFSFLPVEVEGTAFAWAVPFDRPGFTILGSDGDTILIRGSS